MTVDATPDLRGSQTVAVVMIKMPQTPPPSGLLGLERVICADAAQVSALLLKTASANRFFFAGRARLSRIRSPIHRRRHIQGDANSARRRESTKAGSHFVRAFHESLHS
jgi:hypothetical protein